MPDADDSPTLIETPEMPVKNAKKCERKRSIVKSITESLCNFYIYTLYTHRKRKGEEEEKKKPREGWKYHLSSA